MLKILANSGQTLVLLVLLNLAYESEYLISNVCPFVEVHCQVVFVANLFNLFVFAVVLRQKGGKEKGVVWCSLTVVLS